MTNLNEMSKDDQRVQIAKDRKAFEAKHEGESFEVIDDNFISSMDDLNSTLDRIARGDIS